jgi:hypothetical protein
VKAHWTGREHERLSFRGCTIHAVDIGRHEDNRGREDMDDLDDTVPWDRLHLDLGYLDGAGVVPATVAFTWATIMIATIGDRRLGPGVVATRLVIEEFRRIEPEGRWDPSWHITGEGFELLVQDPAYDLYLRTSPRATSPSPRSAR